MRLVLAGPCSTAYFRGALAVALEGAPEGLAQTPVGPLAVELARRGHVVHVVTLDPSIAAPCRLSAGPLALHYLPLRPRARARSLDLFEKEIRLLRREIETISPDVIHAHWTYEYAEAARRADRDCLVTAHDSPLDVFLIFRDAYRFLRLARAAATIPRLRRLTCVSPWIVPRIKLLGFRGDVAVVPNGIDVPREVRRPRIETLLERPVIVCVGNTSRLKNVDAMLRAFPIVKKALPRSELHLFGEGFTKEWHGADGVVPHGSVPHPQLMRFIEQRATILVSPSLSESFGVILIEAMARGVPAVAGRATGGADYILDNALSHLLIDVTNSNAIAEMIIHLTKSSDRYEQITEALNQHLEDRFTIQSVASKFLEMYTFRDRCESCLPIGMPNELAG